jgi:hypothetical protein
MKLSDAEYRQILDELLAKCDIQDVQAILDGYEKETQETPVLDILVLGKSKLTFIKDKSFQFIEFWKCEDAEFLQNIGSLNLYSNIEKGKRFWVCGNKKSESGKCMNPESALKKFFANALFDNKAEWEELDEKISANVKRTNRLLTILNYIEN